MIPAASLLPKKPTAHLSWVPKTNIITRERVYILENHYAGLIMKDEYSF